MQADVNVLDILSLRTKLGDAQKEMHFHNELFRIIDKSEPDSAGEFEQLLKIHVAENYPAMLDVLDRNMGHSGNGPIFRPKPEIFTEDQLDEFYGNSARQLESMVPKERTRSAMHHVPEDALLMNEFPDERNFPVEQNGVVNKKKKRTQNHAQFREMEEEARRSEVKASPISEKEGSHKNKSPLQNRDVEYHNEFDNNHEYNNEYQREQEYVNYEEIQAENDELQDTILQLEEEKRKLETNLKRVARSSNQKPKRATNELTFLSEYELKTLSNPSNMDLMRILNDQEMSYKRLEKSYHALERSYHDLFESDRMESSARDLYIEPEPQIYLARDSSHIMNSGGIGDIRSSEIRRKLAQEKNGNTFVGELNDDISRILNKRRNNQIL